MENNFEPKLINSPNRDNLFKGNLREKDLRILNEALKTEVWFENGVAKAR